MLANRVKNRNNTSTTDNELSKNREINGGGSEDAEKIAKEHLYHYNKMMANRT